MKAANRLLASLCSSAARFPKGTDFGVRQHGTEMLAPERIAHQRESAARQTMERALGIEQAVASGVRAREFDGGFHTFAAGTAEEHLFHSPARAPAQLVRQFAGQFGNMALQHGRTAPVQFILDRLHHRGMIVAQIVNAIAGKKIEDPAAVFGEKLGSFAARVARVHLENIQQTHPLGIHAIPVKLVATSVDADGAGGC